MSKNTDIGLGVRLAPEEYRRLDRVARALGRSPGSVIRALVRQLKDQDIDTIRATIQRQEDGYVSK